MKKLIILLILALIILVLASLPISTNGRSFYNGISGWMFCDSAGGCRHEIGHKMDDDLDHPSRSVAFADAVRVYLFAAGASPEITDADLLNVIYNQPGLFVYSDEYHIFGTERFSSPQEELYASLYEYAGGNVAALPEIFRPFYLTDKKYTDLHSCLIEDDWQLCGVSLHVED